MVRQHLKPSIYILFIGLLFFMASEVNAFDPQNYEKIKINNKGTKEAAKWSDAKTELSQNWFFDEIEPKLEASEIKITGEKSGSYKWLGIKEKVFEVDKSRDGPLNVFRRHYWKEYKQAENIKVKIKFSELKSVDNCSRGEANYWEFTADVNYLITGSPKTEKSAQNIYIVVTDVPRRIRPHEQDVQKTKRIKEWSEEPTNFCKNNQVSEVNESLINRWLDEDVFNGLDVSRMIMTQADTYKNLSLDRTVLPSLLFSETFQKSYDKGTKRDEGVQINRDGQAKILKTCSEYSLDYWEVKVPISYSFKINGKEKKINSDLYLGLRKKQEKDNTPYGLWVEAWYGKDIGYCDRITNKTKKQVTPPELDEEIQAWVKENLPDGFKFYLVDDVLYMPKNIYGGHTPHFAAAGMLQARMIGFLAGSTEKAQSSWLQTLFKKGQIEGQLKLADAPSFSTSCAREGGKVKGKIDFKEYTWDMKWPLVINIGGKGQKYEHWIHVKRIEKENEPVKTIFYGFSDKSPRACARENIERSMKSNKNMNAFRKLLNKNR